MRLNYISLDKAKAEKNDECYTQYEDIEKELVYYKEVLKGKIVYCNCDHYQKSNFVKYFKDNFREFQLKKIVATNYSDSNEAYHYEFDGYNETVHNLNGNGSYDSEECLEILNKSDVVITNPPFSKAKFFLKTLLDNNKDYLFISTFLFQSNTKNVFEAYLNNRLYIGISTRKRHNISFEVPYELEAKSSFEINNKRYILIPNISWSTSFNIKPIEKIELTKEFDYNINVKSINNPYFNVPKTTDIPKNDYITIPIKDNEEKEQLLKTYGKDVKFENDTATIYKPIWGVPVSAIVKLSKEQFDIINIDKYFHIYDEKSNNIKRLFTRILIRKK